MESQHQKWVNLSYLFLAGLFAYIIFAFSLKIGSTYDLEARVKSFDLIVRLLSIAMGGLVFFVLYSHEQANQFMNEVVVELSRVTWPTQKETTSATFVVIIMVLICGIVLGLFDFTWTKLLQWIL